MTRGPPVKVNFELATPNSVHGCTLARPTSPYEERGWDALCTCSARANVLALLPFPASTGKTVGTADTKLTGHMYATPAYILLWLPFL